jgi:hypothetical protein
VTAGANARRTRHAAVLIPDNAAMTEIIPTPMLEISSHASLERKCRTKEIVQRVEQGKKEHNRTATASMATIGVMSAFCSMKDAATRSDRHDPENPVVRVIGRREPGEIDPGPADCETRKRKAEQRRHEAAGRNRISELRCCEAETRCERQVEEQFQWRRDTVGFVRIAATHAARLMAEGIDA